MDQLNNPSEQRPLPNATAVLVLGILSIVVCFITGIIALVMAKKEMALYNANPGMYTPASLSNIKTGRICAIIGIVLQGVAVLIYLIIFVVALGAIGASGGFN
ncbi:MAG: CCC motif membrane protein [Lacibacter sp.]